MDFRLGDEEEAFRQEVRGFLRQELPEGWAGVSGFENEADWEVTLHLRRRLAQRGWLTMHWPREYGGQAASPLRQLVFNEEMAYHRAPGIDTQGSRMLAPTLMLWGSEEQKRRFLPPIARGEVQWCQGYSEPGSGSDLASLQTRAVDEGDEFVVNGSKIWTSNAHHADWMFLLARTDPEAPKHRGISFLLVDMRTPGITVRPIVNMAGIHSFNQVFFDNVRVPKEHLVGEQNRGWYVAVTLLDFERSGVHYSAWARRAVEDLVRYAREADGGVLARDPRVRAALADLAIQAEVSRLLAYEVAWMQSRGQVPNKEASISKVFGSELQQRVSSFGVQLLGLHAHLMPGSRWARMDGWLQLYWLGSFGRTIGAGTSEVQRNIIAARGLGLPRG